MNTTRNWTLLSGAALGAGAMFLLDPRRGRARRARVADKAVRAARRGRRAIRATSRDLAHRTWGVAAEVRSRLRPNHPTDDVIRGRARAALGRAVSHPHAVDVTVRNGVVRLSGPVLASEVDELLSAVRSVRGVAGVEQALEVHDSPANTPALQGGIEMDQPEPSFGGAWSLAAKLVVSLAGAVALGMGLARMSASPSAAERP